MKYFTLNKGNAIILTSDLAVPFYNKYLNYHLYPFSVWLDDVYMGMLAQKLSTEIVDISWTFYAEKHAPRDTKLNMIAKCGIGKFLFVSDDLEFYHMWNLILLNEPPVTETKTTVITTTTTTLNEKNVTITKKATKVRKKFTENLMSYTNTTHDSS